VIRGVGLIQNIADIDNVVVTEARGVPVFVKDVGKVQLGAAAPTGIFGVGKITGGGNPNVLVTERGASFGYNTLVSDMRALPVLRATGCPVVFDATHSVQLPGGQGNSSGGVREFVPVLARAAIAVGIAGVFMETHPDPNKALCDGPNAVPLKHMRALLEQLVALDRVVKQQPLLENDFGC
jgi:2-dehydro-3-deoxyphosphooctonate aldolase (KDO 8-P synthase)